MGLRWRTAWVTGASSGIGREVTLRLAGGGVRVAASARSREPLEALAREHAGIVAYPLDVSAREDVAAVVRRICEAQGTPDLVVLSAGIWQPTRPGELDAAACGQSMAVNYLGITNAIEALLPAMRERGSGHLALVASVAGYRGLPRAEAYAPSKAAVISLAEVLKLDLARHGIDVSVVNPGFVATPMTAGNTFPMPFMIGAEEAGRRIVAGLDARRFEIAFPWQMVTLLKLARVLPYPLYFWVARTFLAPPRKR